MFEPTNPEMLVYEEHAYGLDTSFNSLNLSGDQSRTYSGAEYSSGDGELQQRCVILADGADHYGVTALAFDTAEELLWMGNQGGHVTSYYGADLQKFTSFQVDSSGVEVRCLHTLDDSVLALTPGTLRCQMRRGIPIFTHSSANMDEMQCLLQLSHSPDSLLLGGHCQKIIEFSLSRGQEINLLEVGEQGCAILREHSRYVCCGDPSGGIDLRDPLTLQVQHSLHAHTGSLSDFDVHNNLLVTCGFSSRQGHLSVDHFLMVYDLRMHQRAISPIPVLLDPLLLRFMPSFSSRIAVASSVGQVQLVDTLSQPDLSLYEVSNSGNEMSLALDVSSSCQAVALGDSGGSIHLLTSTQSPTFNAFSRPTEFADPIETYPAISIEDQLAVLSAIPMPAIPQGCTLLSDWPAQYINKVYRQTPAIDPEILHTMKMQGPIGYAPNPNTKLRNQVGYNVPAAGNRSGGLGAAGSEARNSSTASSKPGESGEGNGTAGSGTGGGGSGGGTALFVAIPKRYRKTELKHSKMGFDEIDFEQFNKTGFSGLEASMPNSYCNPMLQVLYYLEPVRSAVLSHLCRSEFCLACELSFLFSMLDQSPGGGQPCHAGNFLRALRNAHEAAALGLLLPDQANAEMRRKTNLIALIQSWNRFILHQIHFELLEERRRKDKESPRPAPAFVYKDTDFPSIELQQCTGARAKRKSRLDYADSDGAEGGRDDACTEISQLFGSKQLHVHRCLRCQRQVSRESSLLVCNLIYPDEAGIKGEPVSFCDVVKASLCPEQTTPAWCDQCERFQPTLQSRRLRTLSPLLPVNCGMDNQQEKSFWQSQMDQVVRKAVEVNAADSRGGSPTVTGVGSGKPCRYGTGCTRTGCRFKHPGRTDESPNLTHLYYANSWLPQHIELDLADGGEVSIRSLSRNELDASVEEAAEKVKSGVIIQRAVYELCAVVCYVAEEKKNLVAIINVGPGYHQRRSVPHVSQWYIFNDFSITPVGGLEAVWFSLDWKVPCVLYWRDLVAWPPAPPSTPLSDPPASPITVAEAFREDVCLARQNTRGHMTFTPLAPHETPASGDLVAMDAEFVTLNQEESELRSDGKMATIKPSHMSVARISCIRGQGPLLGTPFIDDYISTQEQVVDYLTKFSGIKPGDLDASCSSKHLTTLKATYLKLRCLLDIGVKFVGHGLRNDFRVINLVVPMEQVVDTVHLFHLPRQRMVSLRFLAWHYLGLKIQSETHDSIEDAGAALNLYQCYQQLEKEGRVQASLEEMYAVGKAAHWKVSGVD